MAVDYSTNACIGCRGRERRARRASTGSTARPALIATSYAKFRSGDGRCRIGPTSPTGEDLEIQRLRGSRFNFAWSNESDRLVIVNARGTNEAECAFFQVEGTFRELVDRSKRLNEMKIVALAFATYHSGIAAVSVDPEESALRKVTLFSFSRDYLQVIPVNGKDSIRLSEGFLPNGIAFGPGNDEITLTSWNSVRTLNIRDGKVTADPSTDFPRPIHATGRWTRRLCHASRRHIALPAS